MNASSRIRQTILNMAYKSNEGHIPSSFSIVEILIAIKNHQAKTKELMPQNIVLSKGHASFGYYAFLNEYGHFSEAEINSVCKVGSKYYGHLPYLHNDQRFHYGSGSLGHGLPYALGLAFGNVRSGCDETIYCVVGDGEANEGTFWESLLILKKFPDLNVKIIIDQNNSSERAIPITSFLNNLGGLYDGNGYVTSVSGHNLDALESALDCSIIIIANTTKGYPVDMLSSPIWHHRTPGAEELDQIKNKLNAIYK